MTAWPRPLEPGRRGSRHGPLRVGRRSRSPNISISRNAVHIGHSTGGGEAARYVAKHGKGRVAKLVLVVGAVPPIMVKTAANPGGLPIEVFERLPQEPGRQPRPVLPRYSFRPFLWLQSAGRQGFPGRHPELVATGHGGGAKAHYDSIKAFPRRISRKTSSRSRFPRSSCTARTTRSCRSMTPPSSPSSC